MRRPRTFLNTILGVVIAAGCSNQQAGPSDTGLNAHGGLSNLKIASCPAPPQASVSKSIGPAGGTLFIGPHKLEVPFGSLRETVTITAETGRWSGNGIRFGPNGLNFRAPVKLTISTANCSGLTWLVPPIIVYTDAWMNILYVQPSVPLLGEKKVIGWLDHFSQYAVAF